MSLPHPAFTSVSICRTGVLAKRPRASSPTFLRLRLHPRQALFQRRLQPVIAPYPAHTCLPPCATADRTEGPAAVPPALPRSSQLPDAKFTFWVAAATEACAALFAVVLCTASGLPVLGKGWAVSGGHVARAVAAAVPFSAVFWALERAPTGIQAATEASFRSFFGARAVWEVALFCICVAFGEELLFRSWLLAGLEMWRLPTHVALVSSSVVFGVLHAYTKVYMILASLAGFLFGCMFLASGQSVLEPLVVHFLYDFCTILVMQRKWLSGDDD